MADIADIHVPAIDCSVKNSATKYVLVWERIITLHSQLLNYWGSVIQISIFDDEMYLSYISFVKKDLHLSHKLNNTFLFYGKLN